ncbi:hypothetical protein [Kordiimonas lacus]|uniref:Uncharacterized protein n=1 Tax=Kordiimonas lacus TaxID=637679 RepID=A0A1G7E592_9PROT|nr:hypothetical protein [Kordiimonas lacus]SDE58545.1 hypothetical protein SAMN04488071_3279 [Kordiimonas lacus]
MEGLITLAALVTLLWLPRLATQRYSSGMAIVVAAPIIAQALWQGLGYLAQGYLDPFFLIALAVSLLASGVLVGILEGSVYSIHKKWWRIGLHQRRKMVVISAAAILLPVTVFVVPEIIEKVEFRRSVETHIRENAIQLAERYLRDNGIMREGAKVQYWRDDGPKALEYWVSFQNETGVFAKVKVDLAADAVLAVEISGPS